MKKLLNKKNIILVISIFVLLLVIHFPLLTKNIIGADILLNNYFYNGFSWEISLGRFGLYVVGLIKGFLSFPHLDLFISFILISFSVLLLLSLFKVEKTSTKVLSVLLFSLSPIISATLLFHYCSIGYFLAFLFGILAVYTFYKSKNKVLKYLLPIIFICISLSMYQAYLSFIVTLFVMYNLYLMINNKIDYKETFKFILVLLVSVILYFIVMKLSLLVFNIDMASYSNANNIGISTILSFPSKILDSYVLFYKFFFTNEIMKNTYFHNDIINILLLICLIASYLIYIIKNKTSKVNIILGSILILLLPVFLNCVIFVVSDAKLQLLMSFSYLLIFFIIILLSENKYTKYVTYILLALLFRNYLVQDQATYMSLENTFNKYDTVISSAISSNVNNLDKSFAIIGNIKIDKDNELSKIYDENYGYISDEGIFWDEYNLRKIAFERFVYEYYGVSVNFTDEDNYNYILGNRNNSDVIYEVNNTIVIDLYNY